MIEENKKKRTLIKQKDDQFHVGCANCVIAENKTNRFSRSHMWANHSTKTTRFKMGFGIGI